jgi:hypothetical protein
MGKKTHTLRHSGNRAAVIRNAVFSIGCWIPGSAFSRPGMTTFLFRFNKINPERSNIRHALDIS